MVSQECGLPNLAEDQYLLGGGCGITKKIQILLGNHQNIQLSVSSSVGPEWAPR